MSELQQIVDDLVAGGLPGAVALIDRSGEIGDSGRGAGHGPTASP